MIRNTFKDTVELTYDLSPEESYRLFEECGIDASHLDAVVDITVLGKFIPGTWYEPPEYPVLEIREATFCVGEIELSAKIAKEVIDSERFLSFVGDEVL